MRVLERHEAKIVAGGLSSDPNDQLNEDLQDIINWMNGAEYGDADIMGDAYSESIEQQAFSQVWFQETNSEELPDSPDGSIVNAIVAALFMMIGVDTGYDPLTGKRWDGQQDGAGCGDVKTDFIVPDKIFGLDLTPLCVIHDNDYEKQIGKDAADTNFKNNVYQKALNEGWPEWAASAVSSVYYTAVHNLGDGAYQAAAQRAAQGSGSSGGSTGGGGGGGGGGKDQNQEM